MANPVIAIGLDAADPALLEQWMDAGKLPNMSRLRQEGAYGRLRTFDQFRAETPWTTFLTSRLPRTTGYYGPVKYRADDYQIERIQAYDFAEYAPFYALGERARVCVFDMPQAPLSRDVSGVQVLAWGAHSPQTPSCSEPPELLNSLTQRHGENPLLRDDVRSTYNPALLKQLQKDLELGIRRKAAICRDLVQREPWDLFLTVFGEPHSAAHCLWHITQKDHPLHAAIAPHFSGDPMLEVQQAIDRAIGEIVAAGPDDASVVLFAAHGSGLNVNDLPSVVILPEFLYRLNYPGHAAIAPGPTGATPPPRLDPDYVRKLGFGAALWRTVREGSAFKQLLKRQLPFPLFRRLEKFLGGRRPLDVDSPMALAKAGQIEPFQATTWYRRFWPEMKAIALPSYSEGYIRINLRGRDPSGVVAPEDYERTCDEIIEKLRRMKDARAGVSMVKDVIRTRSGPDDHSPGLPDADLVVLWQEDFATDVVDSPDVGMIGPLPFLRTASHREHGFVLLTGDGVSEDSSLPESHALDLAPTILRLMGQPVPEGYEGKSLLEAQPLP